MEVAELKKQCPFCGEEILSTAKKCKHCGEWLEGKPDTEIHNNVFKKESQEVEESMGFGGRIIGTLILAGIGWALFYFGSWHLIFGKKIDLFLQYLSTGKLKQQNVILESDGFVFRINEKYFGFVKDGHFFDSPVIQWTMLILSIVVFFWAIEMLLFGSFENDD
jgi:hypothetical protein